MHPTLWHWICSSALWFTVCGNLNRICTLLLCENYVNINYIDLVPSAFQIYYILLLFCPFILLFFESLILKLQLKILIYQLKKIIVIYSGPMSSLVAQMVKNLPAMWKTQVQSLSWEDSLEKGMAMHASMLPGRIPWTVEPDGLQSMWLQRVRHD